MNGLEPLLRPKVVLPLGEIHGTREAPAFTATVVCLGLARGLGLTLALQLPHMEEEAVRVFFDAAPEEVGSSAPTRKGVAPLRLVW